MTLQPRRIVTTMRSIAIVCVLCGVASADATDEIRALVVANANASAADDHDAFNATMSTIAADLGTARSARYGSPRANFWGTNGPPGVPPKVRDAQHKLTDITTTVTGALAYFRATFDASYQPQPDSSPRKRVVLRATGVAKHYDKTWKLVAIAYLVTMPDKELFKHVDTSIAPETTYTASAMQRLVRSWFDPKSPVPLAHVRATKIADVSARGTAPDEVATGVDAVDKLVKKWDTLYLFATFAADHEWGDLAWVHASIGLPVKGGAMPMELLAILVNEPDGGGWHWVSLDFGAPTDELKPNK